MARKWVKIEGLREAERALKDLGPDVARRVLRTAVKKGAEPMLHAARSKAPFDEGLLVSTIKVRTGVNRRRGSAAAKVTTKDGDYKGESFYGSFIEYGTDKMPAQPYLRPAFDENKERSVIIIKAEIAAGVIREAKKAERKAAALARRAL